MANLFDLSGRVAVVVGATSGLGRAIAIGLAQHGADVVPSGRRKELVESACEEIKALGRRTLVHPANVHDRQSIDALRDAVLKHLGRVDILVNAAGNVIRQPTIEVLEEQWSSVLDTHLNGALRACQSFYEPLKASGHGRIINIASLSSFTAFYQVAAYSAAKTAVVSLDADPGLRVGEGWDSRECHRAGRVSHRLESSDHHGHAARPGTLDAHSHGTFWPSRKNLWARLYFWLPMARVS